MAEGGVLPPAIQTFVANAEEWTAGIAAMIAADDKLLASIEEVKAAAAEAGLGADTGAAEAVGGAGAAEAAAAESEAAAAEARVGEVGAEATAGQESLSAAQSEVAETGEAAAGTENTFAASMARSREAAATQSAAIDELIVSCEGLVGAVDEVTAAVAVENKELDVVIAKEEEVTEGGTGLAAMGGTLKLALLAGAAALAVGIDKAEHFQEDLTRLQTAAGLTGASMAKVAQQVLVIGDATGFTGDEIAQALYHPISAGLSLAQSLKLVTYSAELAQIHGANLEDTTYSLSSIMKAYNLNLGQVGHTAALVNAIVGQGDMRFQDFNGSIQAWTPTMASMGITIQSAGAALAYLTDRGMSATQAATRLSMGLTMVTSGSEEANTFLKTLGLTTGSVTLKNKSLADVMNHYGLTTNKVAAELKKPDGIYTALSQINEAFRKSGLSASQADAVMAKIFGGGRSDKAIVDLMQNLTGVKTKYDDIGKAVSNFGGSWAKTESTAHFHWTQFKADIANVVTEFGMALLPTFIKIAGAISKFLAFLTAHPALAKLAGFILALAGAAAIAGPVVAGLATAVGILISPVALVVGAIALLAIGIYLLWTRCKAFRDAVHDVANALRDYWNFAWHNAAEVIKWFVNGPLKWIEAQINMFKQFWANNGQEIERIAKATWAVVAAIFTLAWGIIWAFMKAGLTTFEDTWRDIWKVVVDVARLTWDLITQIIHMALQLALGIIQTALELMQGHWSAALHTLYNLTGEIWHDIANLIKTVVSGLVGILFDLGRAIVQALVSGMKSMLGAVTSIGHDIANAVSSAVGGALKMFSPSRVMYEHGRNVVLGFVQGIQENLGLVTAAMNRVGTNTAGGLYGSPGRTAGLAGGQNIQVQVNLGQTMSTAAWQHGLQQQIQQAVLDYAIRNPGSGLVLPAKGR